jgi:hypothetical protein
VKEENLIQIHKASSSVVNAVVKVGPPPPLLLARAHPKRNALKCCACPLGLSIEATRILDERTSCFHADVSDERNTGTLKCKYIEYEECRLLGCGAVYILCLQLPTHAGFSRADFSTLKMEAILSSETSVHTISTRRHIPQDGILHSHRRVNLKSYIEYIEKFLSS